MFGRFICYGFMATIIKWQPYLLQHYFRLRERTEQMIWQETKREREMKKIWKNYASVCNSIICTMCVFIAILFCSHYYLFFFPSHFQLRSMTFYYLWNSSFFSLSRWVCMCNICEEFFFFLEVCNVNETEKFEAQRR